MASQQGETKFAPISNPRLNCPNPSRSKSPISSIESSEGRSPMSDAQESRDLTPSPEGCSFDKLLSLGFYDGTISGIAYSEACSRCWKYELVAWDAIQKVRIFSMALIPKDAFDAIVALISPEVPPTWPVWSPIFNKEQFENVERTFALIDAELCLAAEPRFVLATEDLMGPPLAIKLLSALARLHLPGKDTPYPSSEDWSYWSAFLFPGT